eukprot:3554405-Pyramimonas_sp.AAC.1
MSGYRGAEKQAPVPPAPTHPLCAPSVPPQPRLAKRGKGSPPPCCVCLVCMYACCCLARG